MVRCKHNHPSKGSPHFPLVDNRTHGTTTRLDAHLSDMLRGVHLRFLGDSRLLGSPTGVFFLLLSQFVGGFLVGQGSDSSMGLFVFPIRVMWGSTRMEDHLCFPLGFPDSHGYETGSIPFPSPFPPGSHVGVIGPHSTSPPCPTTVGVVAPRSLRHQRIQTNT